SAYAWILEKDQYWDYLEEMLPKPPKVFWWLIIGFTGLIVIGKVTYEYDRALLRRGWQHLMVQTAPLPSNTIYDLHLRSNGDMMIATAQGAALWHVSEGSPWGEDSLVYNRQNSGIGDDHVRAVYEDRQGNLWFGTESGLSCLCKGEWKQIPEAGLSEQVGKVRSFVEDTKDNLWIGTLNGLFMWNGSQLISYSQTVNFLPDLYIFAIAHQIVHDEEYLWLGTQKGVTRLKLSAQTMDSWDFSSRDLGWGGVSHLIVDTQNRVWITTIGGGIGRWDDKEWTFYRLGSSNLPTSVVNSIIEQPGKGFWLGHGFPTEPGGLVSRFDGVDEWTIYRQNNSGFNGGEPMAFAFDPIGRLWIGTAIDGLQIYDPALAKR
ncbi:MAG: two-component regulator propeller domain-containing protein, partial [Bellilinea sp.]